MDSSHWWSKVKKTEREKEKISMNGFQKFMMGRYGGDQLGMFLVILSVILTVALTFVPIAWINLLSWIPLAFAIYRMFSKRVEERQRENYAFLRGWGKIRTWFWNQKNYWKDAKTYRYFKCANCGQKLRVPKGKGKIKITCSRCGNQFLKKT